MQPRTTDQTESQRDVLRALEALNEEMEALNYHIEAIVTQLECGDSQQVSGVMYDLNAATMLMFDAALEVIEAGAHRGARP